MPKAPLEKTLDQSAEIGGLKGIPKGARQDLGGGVRGKRSYFSGIRPLHQLKGPLLILFFAIHFTLTNPCVFLKVSLAPLYSNFKGERTPK